MADAFFNPEIDTGDFDPIETAMLEDALAEGKAGDKAFRRIVATHIIKQPKRCQKVSTNFNRRLCGLEKWRTWIIGFMACASILIPVISWLLVQFVF